MRYDVPNPVNRMWVRALATAVALLVSPFVAAQPRGPWVAHVRPRPSLPAVTVELGYAGPYAPTRNSPLTLRAQAGRVAFDGYIGFHFRVHDRRTIDDPVIAQATLAPAQEWTFSTFASLKQRGFSETALPRDVVIEWRDASMKTIATANAGTPPWTLTERRPLAIGIAANEVLGREAWRAEPGQLSDRAQWFLGFSEVVAPLDVWADLPRTVREAIFGSGLPVVLFGLQRSGQQLDDIDRALLPVTFEAKPGSYRAPWAYGDSAGEVPLSWSPKVATLASGSGSLPYMVRSPIAVWFADGGGIAHPLPSRMLVPLEEEARTVSARELRVAWPRPLQIVRDYSAVLLMLAALLLAIGAWLFFLRQPRTAVIVLLLAAAPLIVAARARIRPPSGTFRYVSHVQLLPGIVDSWRISHVYGESPISADLESVPDARTSVSDIASAMPGVRVRTSHGPPAAAGGQGYGDWYSFSRWTRTRSVGEPVKIVVRSRDGEKLVIDYETPEPIDTVAASWLCGERNCYGSVRVRNARRGTATIHEGNLVARNEERFARMSEQWTPAHRAAAVRVRLSHKSRFAMTAYDWLEPRGMAQSFFIPASSDEGSFRFVLPREVRPDAAAAIAVQQYVPSYRVEIASSAGNVALAADPSRQGRRLPSSRLYPIPPDVFRSIVASGGIVDVRVSKDPPEDNSSEVVHLEIEEKKP